MRRTSARNRWLGSNLTDEGETHVDVPGEDGLREVQRASTSTADRLVGVDVARGLAIIGMIGVHILDPGPVPSLPWIPENWHGVFSGRSRVLFAVVAGISIALMSGRTCPLNDVPLLQARMKIMIRAVIIFAIGSILMALPTNVGVILEYYGALFIIVLPFLRWNAKRLLISAAVLAVVLPPTYVVGMNMFLRGELGYHTTLTRLLLTGQYPVLIFSVYIFAGLGVGRLDLVSRAVQRRLLVSGAVIGVVGLIGAQVVQRLVGPVVSDPSAMPDRWDLSRMATLGQRSGNWFEVLGPSGIALAIVGASLMAIPKFTRLLSPVAATGSMALTIYVAHVVSMVWIRPTGSSQHQWFIATVMVSLLVASFWTVLIGKGPLEQALTWVALRSTLARQEATY